MGLFGSTSPFDPDVEKATSEKNTTEEWGLIMDICDRVGNSPSNAKDCLRSIVKRLNSQDPHVAIQAVTLLDACVNNCGKNFHLEIASREFEGEFRKLLSRTHPTVQLRLKALLKKWAENEFKTDAQLNLIPSLYYKLRQEGCDFSSANEVPQRRTATHHVSKDPNVVANQQEEDDIAKAIELSLKEKGSPKAGRTSANLYPSLNMNSVTTKLGGKGVPTEARKVRALYDFEAAEDNELTFKAGEIVHVIDDSDPNWWKGYNQRGEGLFPANFVTADLSVEPEQFKIEAAHKRAVQYTDEPVKQQIPVEVVEIDENKIDQLLHLLHEADPNDASKDPKELASLEDQVNGMGPLIDAELEQVDRKHAQLTQLSADLVEALNLYHMLMREPQYQPLPKNMPGYNYPPTQGPPPNPNIYNGGPPMTQYPQMPFPGPSDRSYLPPPVVNPMPPHGPGQLPPHFLPLGPGQVHVPPPPGAMLPPGSGPPQGIPNFPPNQMPSYGPPVPMTAFPVQGPPPQLPQQGQGPPPGQGPVNNAHFSYN